MDIIENKQLKEILRKGTKFRPKLEYSGDDIYNTYQGTVEKVVNQIRRFYRVQQEKILELRNFFNLQYRDKIKPLLNSYNIGENITYLFVQFVKFKMTL